MIISIITTLIEKGVIIKVPLLDGNVLTIETNKYNIKNNTKLLFKGLGMIISKRTNNNNNNNNSDSNDRGDLTVKFELH